MAINRVSMTSQSVENNYTVTIEIVAQPPDPSVLNNPLETPGKIIGFYDATLDGVRLYIVDNSGLRWLPV